MPPPSITTTTSFGALAQPLGDTPELVGYKYRIKGITYTFKEKTAIWRKGAVPSRIWSDGYEARNDKASGSTIWVCSRCWNKRNSKGYLNPNDFKAYVIGQQGEISTKNALNHLRKHEKAEKADDGPPAKRKKSVYERLADQAIADKLPVQEDVNSGRERLIRWIIAARLPLASMEVDEFREMIEEIAPALAVYIEPSGNTVRQWIVDRFQEKRIAVKEELHTSLSKIHLSFDLWTAENSLAIIGVVAHYLSKDLESRTRLIAMRSIEGPHTGANQAQVIAEVIEDYEIRDQLGYFVTDNAGNNDTAIDSLCDSLGLEAESRRLRCLGHIINLAVKAFLYGKNAESFEVEMSDLDLKKLEQKHYLELLATWRKKGPVGKLHNIVIWIRRTPQRRQTFRNIEMKEGIPLSSMFDII